MDRNTSRTIAVALTLAGAAGFAGCGSSNAASTTDAGSVQEASTMDVSQPETGPVEAGPSDAGASDVAAPDCGATAPSGKQIVASTAPLVLQGGGVTSDGYAFYVDSNTEILYAVSAAGGSPTSLGSMTSQSGTFYLNGGKTALFLPKAAGPTTELAPLSAWSEATGASVISTSAFAYDSYDYTYDDSQDGSYVAYFASTDSTTAALTVSTTDGKTQRALVSNIDLTNQDCSPIVQFDGDTIVAYYCLAAPLPDSGIDGSAAGKLTIASFAVTSAFDSIAQVTLVELPAPTDNTPLQYPDAVSPDGTRLLVVDTAGLELYPVAGGAPTMIDPNGTGGGFVPSGSVIYGTTSGGVNLYSVADGGAPLVLASGGVPYLLTLSPDGNWLQIAENVSSSGQLTDIWLQSTTTPGGPTQVWGQATASAIGFSADSKYDAFATNLGTNFGQTSFDLNTSPVSGGASTKIITSAGHLAFTTGSKLVTNTNPSATTGAADIEAINLANPGAASTLVTQADPNFFYASGSNKVVYTWYCAPNATAGVWTVDAP
jgi:hypothetical protein